MAREMDKSSKDVMKGGTMFTDKNVKLVTDRKEVLRVLGEHFKKLLIRREKREFDLPSAVGRRSELMRQREH